MKWIVLFSIICNVYVVYHHDITQSFLYNKNDGTSIKINTITNSIRKKNWMSIPNLSLTNQVLSQNCNKPL